MRDAIAVQTNMVAREVKLEVILGWLNVNVEALKELLPRYGWTLDGETVKIPINKENEAKTTVFRENVNFGRTCYSLTAPTKQFTNFGLNTEFQNVVRRAYEQAV
jgi:hypothetical protein